MAEIKVIPVRTAPTGAAPAPVGSPPPPADPVQTSAPLSAESKTEDSPPLNNPILGKLAQARTAGLSWSDINTYLASKRTEAKAAGLTDDDVDKFLGFHEAPSADMRVKADLQAHLTPETTNLFDAVVEGLEKSSSGLTIRGKLPDRVPPEDANLAMRITSKVGETFGDLPAMVVGALGGSAAGGVAASEVPVIGTIGGAIAGGGFGAMALPQAMKATYRDLYLNGNFKGPGDYAARVGANLLESFKSGVSGAAMGLGAETAAAGAASAGFKGFVPQLGAKAAGALTASTAVSSLIEKQLPTPEELTDNAILLIAMGGAGKIGEGVKAVGSALDANLLAVVRANLINNWVDNNERPAEAVKRAADDPVLRAKLVAAAPPPPPEGSVSVKVDGVGPYIIPKFELPEVANKNEAPKAVITENGKTTEYDTKTKEPVAAYPEGSFGDIVSKAAVKHGLDSQLLLGIAHLESASGTDLRTSSAGAKGPFQFVPKTARAYGIEGREMDTAASADAAARLAVDNAKGLQAGLGRAPTNGEIYLAHQQGVEGALKLLKNPDETAASQVGIKAVRGNLPPNMQAQAATITAAQFAQHWTGRFGAGGPGGGGPSAVTTVAVGGGAAGGAGGGVAGGTPLGPPYDPWALVAGRQAGRVDQPNIIQRTLAMGYRAYLELFNPDHPMNQLAEAAAGTRVPGMGDPKFLARIAELSNNRTQYMVERRMVDINGNPTGVRGLNDILGPFANERGPVNFFTYAMARWATEKAAQARETGVLVGAAHDVVTQGAARYAAAFQELVDWQNETLRYLADGHMISMEAYNQFVAENQNYIPGFRIGQNPRGVGNGPGRMTYNSVHEFLGSEDPVQHILTNILRNAFVRVELANRNLANRSLRDAGVRTRDQVTGEPLAEVVPNQARPITLTDQELQNLGIPGGLGGLADPADATVFRVMNRQTQEDEVPVFEDGRLQRVRFADPDITRALRGLNEQQQNVFSKIMSAVTRVTRAAIVLNPFFPIRILLYDMPWQFITKPGFRNTVADAAVGAAHVLGNSDHFDEWMRSGGAERIFDGLSKNAYINDVLGGHEDPSFGRRVWNAITTPVHMLRAWGQTISQFQRVGRFVRGRDAGESMARAGVASSEAAFHRAGYGGPVGKFFNGVQPFFLAHLNGLEQTFRSQFGVGETTTGEAFNGFQFTAKAVAVITIPMLTSWAMNHDKEWYKGAPDWQKNNGLLFHFGPDNGGHTMYLPFPPLISAIYGGIPRMLLDAYAGDNPIEGKKLAEAALGSLLPPGAALSSNVFLPIIEHVTNHSFFRDQPLVSDNTKNNALPAQQEAPFSSEPAKAMAKFFSDLPLTKGMNLSPGVVDNYIKGWGGTMGDAAARTATILLHAGDPKAAPTRLEDWPLLSSWMERFPSANAQPIKDFQAGTAELQQAHGSLEQLMLKGDLAGFQKVLKEYPLATVTSPLQLSQQQQVRGQGVNYQPFVDAYRAVAEQVDPGIASTVKLTDKALQTERLAVAAIYANPDISKADKSQLTDRAYSQMQLIAETGLRALRKARP